MKGSLTLGAQVQAVIVDLDGQRYRLRTDLQGAAQAAFAARRRRPPTQQRHLPRPRPLRRSTETVVPRTPRHAARYRN